MDLATDLTALMPRWRIDGVDMLPPGDPAQVQALFAQLGQPATPEVLTLYTTLGGMATMDGEFWRMWSLDEVSNQCFFLHYQLTRGGAEHRIVNSNKHLAKRRSYQRR